jgi:hypothetical protein
MDDARFVAEAACGSPHGQEHVLHDLFGPAGVAVELPPQVAPQPCAVCGVEAAKRMLVASGDLRQERTFVGWHAASFDCGIPRDGACGRAREYVLSVQTPRAAERFK